MWQTCFKRQKNKLTTHVSGSTVSTIDYLLLRRCDGRIIKKCQSLLERGLPGHREKWWGNEAIEEKRRYYKIWHKTKTASDQNKYNKARRKGRRSVALAQEKARQELVSELESTAGKKNVYRVAKQMPNSMQDAV